MGEAAGAGRAHGAPAKTSGLAIASLVLGIVGLLLTFFLIGILLTPIGLILGIVALVKIGKSGGRLGGKGLGIAGTAVSAAGVLLGLLVVVGLALPAFMVARGRAVEIKCASNLKQIGFALHVFSGDNNEQFPKSLDELVPDYVSDRSVFSCPTAPGVDAYVCVEGVSAVSSPQCVVAYERNATHGGRRNVLFVGSNVEQMDEASFQQAMARTKELMKPRGGRGF